MDVMIILLAGVAIGYGVRTWLNLPSPLSSLAAMEMGTRNGLAPRFGDVPRAMPCDAGGDVAAVAVKYSSVPGASRVRAYPTLEIIDQALESPHVAFADHPGAPMLEQHARQLVAMYWSDAVWLTGLINDASLAVVVSALEADRALAGPPGQLSSSGSGVPAPGS